MVAAGIRSCDVTGNANAANGAYQANMDSLTISVPDEAMSAEVDDWQDGAEYTIRVRQDSPGQFTALSAEAEMDEEAEPTEEAEMPGKGGTHGKMPAVAIVLAGANKK